jgi:hypothetical protein
VANHSKAPRPYRTVAPKAHYFKAWIQMAIGTVAAGGVLFWVIADLLAHGADSRISEHVFTTIGLALAVATAIELAYTLYSDGPDEALNPVMLGLAAALLIQLGQVERFELKQAAAAALYVAALAALFAVRRYLAEEIVPGDWSLFDRWSKSTDDTDDAEPEETTPTGPAETA